MENKTIVSLKSSNVKRLVAVEIEPSEHGLVIVGGQNGQGKTSVLDSIMYALGGGKTIPPKPIRNGEERASIELELSSGLKVTRTFGAKGSAVRVENSDGAQFKRPQDMLDALVGPISFDPLQFSQLNAKSQLATLREVLGVDTAALDALRDSTYKSRTELNRDIKNQAGEMESMEFVPTTERVDTAKLAEELDAARDHNEKLLGLNGIRDSKHLQLENALTDWRTAQSAISRKKEELEECMRDEEHKRKHKDRMKEVLEEASAAIDSFVEMPTEGIHAQITAADSVNHNYLQTQRHAIVKQAIDEMRAREKELTGKITDIDEQKKQLLADIKFPMEGLAFGDEGLLYDDCPLEQASGRDKLFVSASLGLAMNPELKVLLIRDGSLLDDESLSALRDFAEEHEAQVWIERVGTGDESAIIIEDGQVVEEQDSELATNVQG